MAGGARNPDICRSSFAHFDDSTHCASTNSHGEARRSDISTRRRAEGLNQPDRRKVFDPANPTTRAARLQVVELDGET